MHFLCQIHAIADDIARQNSLEGNCTVEYLSIVQFGLYIHTK